MSSITLAFPGWQRLVWAGRLRAMFSGFGFAASVSLAMMVQYPLADFLEQAPTLSAPAALMAFVKTAWSMLPPVLAGLLLLVVVLNLAPPAGPVRVTMFVAAPVAMAACWILYWVIQGEPATFGWSLNSLLNVSLYSAAVAYRKRGRTAETALLQQAIESAALETEVKRAQLQLLRAQIEPHFLFNTLATVLTLSRIDRPAAVEMLDKLLRYFAEALPRLQRDESTLAEELELVDAYLRIHQIRLGSRLAYELTVPANLADVRIPTMVLLTLVENAVKHGIGPALDGGFIRVSAECEQSVLTLKVADSGRGMTAQLGHGSGLANVRHRLAMLYGDAGVLSLAHAEPRGMVATVAIPLRA
jgi:signal transduction histidine kinase